MPLSEIIFGIALNIYASTEWLRQKYRNALDPQQRRKVDHRVILNTLKHKNIELPAEELDNLLKFYENELNTKGICSVSFDINDNIIIPDTSNDLPPTLSERLSGLLYRNPRILTLVSSAVHASLYYAGRRMWVDESPSDAFHGSMLGAAPILFYSAYENLIKSVQYNQKAQEEENHSFHTPAQIKPT